MTDVTIRPATPADIPAIARIYAHAVQNGTATFELEPPDEAEMTRRMTALLDGNFPYLAAESSGALAGYAYAGLYRPRPAYRFTVEDSIYLGHAAAGKGLGRALLTALVAACQEAGIREILAVISDKGAEGSISLHEKLGFVETGRMGRVGFKFGRWLGVVNMQLSLKPAKKKRSLRGAKPAVPA